jgi:drug/metabolite transporter (DMT)-like permease
MNPILAGILAIIIWSVSPLLVIGAGNTPPFMMSFMALTFASGLLYIRSYFLKHDFKEIIFQPLKAYVLTTIGIGGYVVFWFLGFKNAPAFEANTLNYLWPVLLVVFSHVATKESPSLLTMLGLISGFAGTVLLFSQGKDFAINGEFLWGYIFALMGAVIWAVYSTLTRYVIFPSKAMASFMLVPGLISLGIHLAIEKPYVPTESEMLFVILLGFTRLSFVLWDYAMKHAQVVLISSLSYFIPVVSTILLMVLGYVPRNEMILLSAILVIGGCLVVNFRNIVLTSRKLRC